MSFVKLFIIFSYFFNFKLFNNYLLMYYNVNELFCLSSMVVILKKIKKNILTTSKISTDNPPAKNLIDWFSIVTPSSTNSMT